MRRSLLWLLLLVLVFAGSATAAAPADDPEWELITSGIEYRVYQLPDPNNVFVVRMDRDNPQVILESSIAQGKLTDGREAVSGMVARYDQALNFWGGVIKPPSWGTRNKVVVAINGSYFDLSNGIPQGGQVQSGWYVKRFDDLGGWGGFAWKLDRSAFIGECIDHIPEKQFVTYPATAIIQLIADVNNPRGANELVIFTPQYNSQTGTENSGVEVVVEMTHPTMVFPEPRYITGTVRQIRIDEGNSLIPFNAIVLSASGTAAQTLLENVQLGSEIRITQEITSYEYDCATPYIILDWTKTYASIQGAFFFLKEGQIREFNDPGATRRNPRTAIAFNEQYIFFIVVDGRDLYHSIGMTINELAVFTRDILGATWGVAQDGGGSSTMVINGQVVNNTYCNIYSCAGYYTPYIPSSTRYNHEGQSVLTTGSNVISSPTGIERAVANGMLMVVVQPGVYSTAFEPGDPVATISDTEMRLGPGTNYAGFTIIPEGTHGTILEQLNGLEGVLAKASYWWYVDFEGVVGWVPEDALANQAGDLGLLDWFINN
ncbi:MAG: hypothetical protein A2Y88_00095 [Chloroflexi bacterium RBG_13_48_10]|nr:MAG: hypothetical protein A2Y88_00095 [Chloroflexi bacterium RBG_13_48_10]